MSTSHLEGTKQDLYQKKHKALTFFFVTLFSFCFWQTNFRFFTAKNSEALTASKSIMFS